jgi:hypothetical protein
MVKILLLNTLLLISIRTFSCKQYAEGKTLCELKVKKDSISIKSFRKGCEFPEGNKVNCLYVVACVDNKIYSGTSVYRSLKASQDFCLTSDSKEQKSLMVSEKKMDAVLDCKTFSKKKKNNIKLSIKGKTKNCNIDKNLRELFTSNK